MEWQWLKDWWRLKRWRKGKKEQNDDEICYCDDCLPDVRSIITFFCQAECNAGLNNIPNLIT